MATDSLNELKDPDRMVSVLRVMPLGLGGGPLYFRRDVPHAWERIKDELKSLVEAEPGMGIQIHGEKMRVGDWHAIPQHQGW